MDNQTKHKLEVEQAVGEQHQHAWNELVLPFFEAKQAELYEAFMELPTSNTDGLTLIKLQMNSLLMMKNHFEEYINTGKIAKTQLLGEENGH